MEETTVHETAVTSLETPAVTSLETPAVIIPGELTGELKELYDQVTTTIRRSVADQKFSVDNLLPLINIITQTIQRFSNNQSQHKIPGGEKQMMALAIVKHVLADFNKSGQIPDSIFRDLSIAIEVTGPTLVHLAVTVWKKSVEVAGDIHANGCSGCSERNGCNIC
jgi:hypothetical protein